MAAITPTSFKIIRVFDNGALSVVTLAHLLTRQGKLHYVNTDGKAVIAQADTLAKSGATATKGALLGIISTQPTSNLATESATVITEADVFLGAGVLDALNIGAPIFMSAAVAGGLDDTAPATTGNTVIQVGYVVPAWREGGVDKYMRVSTSHVARRAEIVVA